MRKYQPIWEKLKELTKKPASEQALGIQIKAHPLLHARIIKAVIKEKYNDQGWRLQIEPQRSRLSYTQQGNVITFFHKKEIGPQELEL